MQKDARRISRVDIEVGPHWWGRGRVGLRSVVGWGPLVELDGGKTGFLIWELG